MSRASRRGLLGLLLAAPATAAATVAVPAEALASETSETPDDAVLDGGTP